MKTTKTEMIKAVESLINQNLMVITPVHYQVILVEDIWKVYKIQDRQQVCQNFLDYCNMKNAYNNIPKVETPELTIMLKNKEQKVVQVIKFLLGEIKIINI